MTKRGNKKIKLHEFRLGDVEDPDIYSQVYAEEWARTDAGKWARQQCEKDLWMSYNWDQHQLMHVVEIWGELNEKDCTYWKLKFKS